MAADIEAKVEERLQRLHRDPSLLERYSLGVELDEEEVRRAITLEVQTELQRSQSPDHYSSASTVREVLKDRFELIREIGRGAQGRTFLGLDRKTGSQVAAKELLLRDIEDWKAIELFEREAKMLRSLDHPAIPTYIDTFHVNTEQGERFFLVQEFVDGDDFETLLEQGLSFDEAAAHDFMGEVLEILDYLHRRSPPVIHRDIKPSNIMRRLDGSVVLIDFGAVQSVIPNQRGGSTIIGTSGYMPMEQLMGRAEPSTDLYALGATVIHLLSQRHPADLPLTKWRLQFEDYVNITSGLTDLLRRLTAPHAEERYSSAAEVIAALGRLTGQGTHGPGPGASPVVQPHQMPTPSATPASPGASSVEPLTYPPTGEVQEVLNDRYELYRDIGSSEDEPTWLAFDLQNQSQVAIREMGLEDVHEEETAEIQAILERHAEILLAIEHPAIPAYTDVFHIRSGPDLRCFAVQTFASGDDFQKLVDNSFLFDQRKAVMILDEVLQILVYLQRFEPPVLHTRIKPSKVLVGPDDRLLLVDLGGLRDELSRHRRGNQVMGNVGYTPLESLGDAHDASTDLYALGASVLTLLAREAPPSFQRPDWQRAYLAKTSTTRAFDEFMAKLVAPGASGRFATAEDALTALRQLDGPHPDMTMPTAVSSRSAEPAPERSNAAGSEQRSPDSVSSPLESGDEQANKNRAIMLTVITFVIAFLALLLTLFR